MDQKCVLNSAMMLSKARWMTLLGSVGVFGGEVVGKRTLSRIVLMGGR